MYTNNLYGKFSWGPKSLGGGIASAGPWQLALPLETRRGAILPYIVIEGLLFPPGLRMGLASNLYWGWPASG